MKFLIILLVAIVILAVGFFAGSCFIRNNSEAPDPVREGNACIAEAVERNANTEILTLLGKGVRGDLNANERIQLRETLRKLEIPACDSLRQRLTPATPTPESNQNR